MRSSSKLDWVPLWWSEAMQVTVGVTPAAPIRAALIQPDATSTVTENQDITIERIVGQFVVFNQTSDVVPNVPDIIHCRIRAPVPTDIDNLALLEGTSENTPGDFDSASLPSIMWHRVLVLRQNTLTGSFDEAETNYYGAQGFASSLIDCKVNRRLTTGEACVFEIGPMGSSVAVGPSLTLHWGLWLRGLLRFR